MSHGRAGDPRDASLFDEGALAQLRAAVADMRWLLSRGYAPVASLALVGNHYALKARQRKAVRGASASSAERDARLAKRVDGLLDGAPADVDALNAIITTERALGGGPVFIGLDSAFRDVAGVHGSFRTSLRTDDAIAALADALEARGAGRVRWFVDRPVSNSGKLAARLRAVGDERGLEWDALAVPDADRSLIESSAVIASSDALVLDRCTRWMDLVGDAIRSAAPDAWVLDLRSEAQP